MITWCVIDNRHPYSSKIRAFFYFFYLIHASGYIVQEPKSLNFIGKGLVG